jgi:ABC-type branched-subunit amino acid transport system ATPase component
MSVVLRTQDLVKRFGGVTATGGVSLSLEEGGRHALIGPNGAGKTTLVDLLTGALRPTRGRVVLGHRDITDLPQHRRAQLGLVRTFQINQLFPDLTPLEAAAMVICRREGLGGSWWTPLGRYRGTIDEAAALLERLRVADVMDRPTRTLSYGKQRLLEVALALACRPRVLLLDEPAAGVAHDEREEILAAIGALPSGVTLLLIEHDMDLVFRFAERIAVMVNGALLVEGPPEAIAADPRVREAYLGRQGQDA